MGRKRDKPIHKLFEGRYPRGQFSKLTKDMTRSKAWDALDFEQQGLYFYLKDRKYHPTIVDGEVIEDEKSLLFTFPKSEWKEKLHHVSTFQKNMGALIEKGFIQLKVCGQNNMTKSVYMFCELWQYWPDIPPEKRCKYPNWKYYEFPGNGKKAD